MIWHRRRRVLETLDLDMEDHIERETADNVDRGMTPEAARYAALRSFGNVTRLKEQTREVWRLVWLEQLLQDLRYGARMLRRNPGFSTTAILTLALGIGMNTAMFSVVDAVVLQPLPYPHADRLVWIAHDCPLSDGDCRMSRADFVLWKAEAKSFDAMALMGNQDLALSFAGTATTERVGSIQGDFWSMTGARPVFGHLFGAHEPNAVVLTSALFERRFGGDPNVLGKAVELEGHAYTVVGVLAGSYRNLIPQDLSTGDEIRNIEAYIPTPAGYEIPGFPLRETVGSGPTPAWFRIIGKRKPGVSFEQARAEMEALYYRTVKQYPNPYSHSFLGGNIFLFETLTDRLVGRARPTLIILFAAVVFVLLIAVANIANLLLARASTREREIAIRAAVGAGKMRVIRQFLAESVLLALLGGIAGVGLAGAALAVIQYVGSPALPRLEDAHIAASVMVFALLVSLATGVLFGLAPALTLARRNLDEVLKCDSRTSSSSTAHLRMRAILVAAEVALAVVLVISAGLMLKSFQRMTSYPPGLTPDRILTMRVSLAGPYYDRQWPHQSVYLQELFGRLAKLPGVEAFGIDCGQFTQPLRVVGVRSQSSDGSGGGGAVRYVSPGYLKALGMPLLAGKWPSEEQMLDEALVNESFGRKVGGGADIVGRQIKGSFLTANVAGVVADFKDFQLDVESMPQVYTLYKMMPVLREVRIAIRTTKDPLAIAETIRQSVSQIDKDVPVFQVQTLAQELSNSVAARRFNLSLLGIFAATAVLLAALGIYGVIAYLVTQRTAEIGIRMALGASRNSILKMVVRQGMGMVLAGIVIGLAVAAGLTRFMASMLYGVTAGDPRTFGAVTLWIATLALLACVGPALRAALIDPMAALRNE